MSRNVPLVLIAGLAVACAPQVKAPDAKIAVSGGSTSVLVGALVQLDGSQSSDPQKLALAFHWSLRQSPAGSVAQLDATEVISPAFYADKAGDYVVALVVSDGVLSSPMQMLRITASTTGGLSPCGSNVPQVSAITFTQGSSVEATDFPVTEPDAGAPDAGEPVADAGALDAGSADAGSSDAGAIDAGPADAGPADAGAPDAGGPLFSEAATIQLVASVVDVDTDPTQCTPAEPAIFTYKWSLQVPPGSAASLSSTTASSPTFVPDLPGSYTAAVEVTDLNGHTGPMQSSVLTVSNCGEHVPVVTFTQASAQATANGHTLGTAAPQLDTPITLTATAVSADNGTDPITHVNCDPSMAILDPVTVSWAFVSVPFASQAQLLVPAVTQTGGSAAEPLVSSAVFYPDQPGNYVIRLGGSAANGKTASPTVITVSVGGCGGNHPPVATNLAGFDANSGAQLPLGPNAVQLASTGQTVQLKVAVSDADNANCMPLQTFSWNWSIVTLPGASHASLNDPTAATPGITLDAAGTYTFRVVVTDSTGLSSVPVTGSITASASSTACGNRPPAITVQLPNGVNIAWNQIVQVQTDNALLGAGQNPACTGSCVKLFSTNDADNACVSGLSLSFAWSFLSLPPGSHAAFFNSNVQNPSFFPDVANADYVLQLTATDNRGLSATASARLHVPQTGANPPAVVFNGGLVSAPLSFNAAGASGAPTITGAQVGVPVGLNLNGCLGGQTPQLTDADDSGSTCQGSLGPQTFTYAWMLTSAPSGSSAQVLNPTTATPSIVPDVSGNYVLQLVVTDSTGLSSAPASVTVIAGCGANVKPVLGAITASPSGTAIVGVGEQLSVTVTNVDSSNFYTQNNTRLCQSAEAFTYAWSFTSLPPGSTATFDAPTAQSPTFVPDVPSGTWGIQVTVTDSQGRSTSSTSSISTAVCGAQSPRITNVIASATLNTYGGAISGSNPSVTYNSTGNPIAGTALFQVGSTVTLVATATSPDNSCGASRTLTYSWSLSGLPPGSGANLVTSGAAASITPDVPSPSASTLDYAPVLTVTDNTGRSTSAVFPFAVSNCGTFTPTVNNNIISLNGVSTIGQAMTFTVAGPSTNITDGNVTACFPAAFRVPAAWSYQWDLVRQPSGSSAVLQGGQSTTASVIPDAAGRYDVSLVVTDATGATSTVTPAVAPSPGVVEVNVGACGTVGPTVLIGAADCGLAGTNAICEGPTNAPGTGLSPYACGSGNPCLTSAASANVNSDEWVIGSLTAPANNACLSTDTWATMSYQWQLVSAPIGSMATLSHATAAGAGFKADVSGTYVVSLTVTNELGKTGTASITLTR
jgi:hypothetical protein